MNPVTARTPAAENYQRNAESAGSIDMLAMPPPKRKQHQKRVRDEEGLSSKSECFVLHENKRARVRGAVLWEAAEIFMFQPRPVMPEESWILPSALPERPKDKPSESESTELMSPGYADSPDPSHPHAGAMHCIGGIGSPQTKQEASDHW